MLSLFFSLLKESKCQGLTRDLLSKWLKELKMKKQEDNNELNDLKSSLS